MSANTSLWGTIEGALRESGWLILLATPEAAASEYVNNEVTWWVENKSAATILLVHAAGKLSWDRASGGFSSSTDSVPRALRHAYTDEPRWIDMRWFSEPVSLGKGDARFLERVADLASAVRNQERDALVGENVRQRRRAISLLRAGIIALSGLLIVSLVATVVAVTQSNEAVRQRDVAQLQARIASARQLAATSQSLLAADATTAKLLAVYGYQLHADAQTQAALLAAVSAASGDDTTSIDVGEAVTALGGPTDGSSVLIGTEGGRILRWTPGRAKPSKIGKLKGAITAISSSEDGHVVAASSVYTSGVNTVGPAGAWASGKRIDLPSTAEAPVQISPSGDTVGFATSLPDGYVSKDFYGDSGFSYVRSADGYKNAAPARIFSPMAAQFVLPDDDTVVAWVDGTLEKGEVQHRKLGDFSILTDAQTPGGVPRDHPGQLSPDGKFLVQVDRNSTFAGAKPTEIPFYDSSSDSSHPVLFGYAPTTAIDALAISPDSKRFATASSGTIYVSKPRTIEQAYGDPLVLAGSSSISTLVFLNSSTLVSASGNSATIRRLDAGNPLQKDVEFSAATLDGAANGLPLRLTLNRTGKRLVTLEQGTADFTLEDAYGTSNWRTVGNKTPNKVALVPLAWKSDSVAFVVDVNGLATYDSRTHKRLGLKDSAPIVVDDLAGPADAPTEDRARYLPKEQKLFVAAKQGVLELDSTTGAIIKSWPKLKSASLSNNARYAVTSVPSKAGAYTATLTDLTTGSTRKLRGKSVRAVQYLGPYLAVAPTRQSVVLLAANGVGQVGTFAETFSGPLVVSSDGALAARFTDDGFVSVISVTSGQVLGRFNIHGDSRAHVGVVFSGDGKVLVGARTASPKGSYSIVDLNPKHWIRLVCASAGRDFTSAEWLRYTSAEKPAGLGCANK